MTRVTMQDLRDRARDLNQITGRNARQKSDQFNIEHWSHASRPYRLRIGQHSVFMSANSKTDLMAQLDAYYSGVAYGRAFEQGIKLQAFADDLIAINGAKVIT